MTIILFYSLFMVMFGLTMPMMAGLYIVSDLGGSPYLAIYGVTFFAIGNVLSVCLSEPLSTTFGSKKTLLSCQILFAFCSLMCGISTHYYSFICWRFIAGLVTGPLFLLVFKMLVSHVDPEKKQLYISYLMVGMAVVPVIGACWGGYIAYDFHWQWLYFINAILILISFLLVLEKIPEYEDKVCHPFDWLGYLFFFAGVLCIGSALTTAQELDWYRSLIFDWLMTIGSITLLYFILRSLIHPFPVIHFRHFKNPVFCFAIININLLFSIYFGMVILLGLWLNLYVNYTPIWIVVLIGTMVIAGFFPLILFHPRTRNWDIRVPLGFALIFLIISSFHTSTFSVDINFSRIAFSRILAGFGLVMFLPPLFQLCFHTIPEEKHGEMGVLFHLARLLGSGVGAAIFVIIWHRRQDFYHERLGSQLTAFSQNTRDYFMAAHNYHLYGKQALAELSVLLDRQSTALALDDCFYLMGYMAIGLLILLGVTLLLPREHFHHNLIPKKPHA